MIIQNKVFRSKCTTSKDCIYQKILFLISLINSHYYHSHGGSKFKRRNKSKIQTLNINFPTNFKDQNKFENYFEMRTTIHTCGIQMLGFQLSNRQEIQPQRLLRLHNMSRTRKSNIVSAPFVDQTHKLI